MTHARRPMTEFRFAVVHIFKGAFVSHKLFRSILFACLFACALLSFPAFAQTGAVPQPLPQPRTTPMR